MYPRLCIKAPDISPPTEQAAARPLCTRRLTGATFTDVYTFDATFPPAVQTGSNALWTSGQTTWYKDVTLSSRQGTSVQLTDVTLPIRVTTLGVAADEDDPLVFWIASGQGQQRTWTHAFYTQRGKFIKTKGLRGRVGGLGGAMVEEDLVHGPFAMWIQKQISDAASGHTGGRGHCRTPVDVDDEATQLAQQVTQCVPPRRVKRERLAPRDTKPPLPVQPQSPGPLQLTPPSPSSSSASQPLSLPPGFAASVSTMVTDALEPTMASTMAKVEAKVEAKWEALLKGRAEREREKAHRLADQKEAQVAALGAKVETLQAELKNKQQALDRMSGQLQEALAEAASAKVEATMHQKHAADILSLSRK